VLPRQVLDDLLTAINVALGVEESAEAAALHDEVLRLQKELNDRGDVKKTLRREADRLAQLSGKPHTNPRQLQYQQWAIEDLLARVNRGEA
jgi:hypothetical protein